MMRVILLNFETMPMNHLVGNDKNKCAIVSRSKGIVHG